MNKETFDTLFVYGTTQQRLQDWHWCIDKIESTNPKIVIEIGVFTGGSLRFWEHIVPSDGVIIGVDNVPQPIYYDWNKNGNVKLVNGDSTKIETAIEVENILNNKKADFLLIDGGHLTLDGGIPERDFNNFAPLVKIGGLICVADLGADCASNVFLSLPNPKETEPHAGMGFWTKTQEVEIQACNGSDKGACERMLKLFHSSYGGHPKHG